MEKSLSGCARDAITIDSAAEEEQRRGVFLMAVTVLGKIREAIVPFSVERLQGKIFLSTSGMRITLSTCGNTLDAAQSSAERALTCFLEQHVHEKISVRRVPSASEVAGWDPEQILFLCTMHTPGAYAEFHDLFA